MMKWQPQDIVAVGLLGWITFFLLVIAYLRLNSVKGVEVDYSGNKEIVIYIVGVLSGYIGLRNYKKDKDNGN